MAKQVIESQIKEGTRPQGAELKEDDIGFPLAWQGGFGQVLPIDVGKRVWSKDYGLVMENNEQRDKRLAKGKRYHQEDARMKYEQLEAIRKSAALCVKHGNDSIAMPVGQFVELLMVLDGLLNDVDEAEKVLAAVFDLYGRTTENWHAAKEATEKLHEKLKWFHRR